jgi:hypothetical protein
MSGFKVPEDLADKDLTLTEVKRILDNRKAMKRIQTRIDGLPAKEQGLRAEYARLNDVEADLLNQAADRAEADVARAATASEGHTAPDDTPEG